MLPNWHIKAGAIFSILLWVLFPSIGWLNIILVFLSSFLIDFDHYVSSIVNSKRFLSLKDSYNYYEKQGCLILEKKKKGIKIKGDFHIFHTLEFHLLILILGLFWSPFIFIFIGMIFHSICDIYDLVKDDFMFMREFFLVNYLYRKVI